MAALTANAAATILQLSIALQARAVAGETAHHAVQHCMAGEYCSEVAAAQP